MDEILYILTAAVGGTLFLGQLLLSLLGIGGDHDLDLGHLDGHDLSRDGESSLFFGLLSFRAITAALAFFGLCGLAARSAQVSTGASLIIAVVGGLLAMIVVAAIMRALWKLRDDGTEHIAGAVGARGVVYLTIPGKQTGFGKVHLDYQNRTVELRAVTFQNQLPTGTDIIVVSVIGTDTVEVVAAPETARIAHA